MIPVFSLNLTMLRLKIFKKQRRFFVSMLDQDRFSKPDTKYRGYEIKVDQIFEPLEGAKQIKMKVRDGKAEINEELNFQVLELDESRRSSKWTDRFSA